MTVGFQAKVVGASAKLLLDHANRLDAAWLKTADPRAVQGGAFCEEAAEARKWAGELAALALDMLVAVREGRASADMVFELDEHGRALWPAVRAEQIDIEEAIAAAGGGS